MIMSVYTGQKMISENKKTRNKVEVTDRRNNVC